MFNSLKVSAEEGDTKELIEKLNTYTKTNLKSDAFKKYKDVNHVNIRSLKSIIISKLTEMYNLEISYNFECDEVINKIPPNINEIDLVRIIGITCDNAIEESRELIRKGEDAQIEIMIYSTEETLEYEIQNKKRNLAITLLEKLLKGKIKAMMKSNKVTSEKFEDMLQKSIDEYNQRGITSEIVIRKLIDMAKKINAEQKKGKDLGLSQEEIAFYDALADHKKAVEVLGEKKLHLIAQELVKLVKEEACVDRVLPSC